MKEIICSCCGKIKKSDDYYSSQSYFMKATGKVHTCKQCLWEYVIPADKKSYDFNKVYETLQAIDRPFIYHLWQSSIEEVESRVNKPDVFKIYMKNIGMKDFRDLKWSDSIFEDDEGNSLEDDFSFINGDDELTEEMLRYWGLGYSDDEYKFLEYEKTKLTASFECPDYGMEMIMKDICFINLEIERIRQERKDNSQKVLTNLIETRSKLMNDANMKPIQSTGAEANDQVTFGTLIRKWENERPVPKPLDDEMKEYIDTYMIGHLAKMEGLNNDMTKKYDEALAKYTINYHDLNKNTEEWDD